MKKIVLTTVVLIGCVLAVQAQVRVGIKGGGSLVSQRVNSSGNGTLYSNDDFKTWHAGLVADIAVAERISVQPQLLYTKKGATLLSSDGAADATVRMKAVELPVTVLYKLPVSFGKLFAGAGVSFGYAVSGSETQNGNVKNLYKAPSAWRREDLGFHFTAGIELNNGLFASIGSQKSLLDAYKPDAVSVTNRSTAVSVGYLIDWTVLKGRRS